MESFNLKRVNMKASGMSIRFLTLISPVHVMLLYSYDCRVRYLESKSPCAVEEELGCSLSLISDIEGVIKQARH